MMSATKNVLLLNLENLTKDDDIIQNVFLQCAGILVSEENSNFVCESDIELRKDGLLSMCYDDDGIVKMDFKYFAKAYYIFNKEDNILNMTYAYTRLRTQRLRNLLKSLFIENRCISRNEYCDMRNVQAYLSGEEIDRLNNLECSYIIHYLNNDSYCVFNHNIFTSDEISGDFEVRVKYLRQK